MLARTQTQHGLLGCCINSKVKSAQAFDGNNASFQEQIDCFLNRVCCLYFTTALIKKHQARPALPAADRLGMKPAIKRVMIFPFTLRTQGKRLHGCLVTVVGNILNDGEAGAAVGAVYERIAVSSVGRVKQLPETIITHIAVRGNKRHPVCERFTFMNGKSFITNERNFLLQDGEDTGQGRGVILYLREKIIERLCRTFYFNFHTPGAIQHPAGHAVFTRKRKNKGAEAHPLYNSLNLQV